MAMAAVGPLVKKQRCQMMDEKGTCTSSSETNYRHVFVPSLFNVCIEFVAKNIHLVDSLNGFPDIVALKIFKKAKQLGKFQSATSDTLAAVGLFCEAYGSVVLHSLNLRSCHLGIANYLDHLCLFTELTELDIGHCGLGDEHELLQHLSDCHRLIKLGLCHNALSDVGLQKLTTPLRMFKRGPIQLQELDLSDNADITFRVSRYLKSLCSLQRLNLSGTSLKSCQFSDLEAELGLKSSPHLCPEHGFSTETKGWAAEIVSNWMTHTAQRTKVVKPKTKTGKFYHKKVDLQDVAKHQVEEKPIQKHHCIVYFVRETRNNTSVRESVSSTRQREIFPDLKTNCTKSFSLKIRHPQCVTKKRKIDLPNRQEEAMKGSDLNGDAKNDFHLLTLYSSSAGKGVQSQKRVSLSSSFDSW